MRCPRSARIAFAGGFEIGFERVVDQVGQVLVGEVDGGFNAGQGFDHGVLQFVDGAGQGACRGGCGSPEAVASACADAVDDGFGLDKVDAAVEKGALGELAGTGQAWGLGRARLRVLR